MSETTGKPFSLRAAKREDAAALCAIRNLPGVRWGTLALPFARVEASEAYLAKLGPNNHVIVAEAEGVPIGSASLDRFAGRRAHVAGLGLMVADHWQGTGVGTALIGALTDLADNWLGLRRIELSVFADNGRAIALYEKFGFVEEGRQRAYALRDGVLVDSLLMARLRD